MSDQDKHYETAYLLSSKANRDLLPLDVAGPDVVYTSPGPGIEEEQVLLAA